MYIVLDQIILVDFADQIILFKSVAQRSKFLSSITYEPYAYCKLIRLRTTSNFFLLSPSSEKCERNSCFDRAILLRPPMKIYRDRNYLYMKYDYNYNLLLLVDMKTTLNEGHVVSGLILQMNKN